MGVGKANAKAEKARVKYEKKKAAETEAFAAAEGAGFKDGGLNLAATSFIDKWRDANGFNELL